MRLLSQDRLIKTGPVDHADWNYRGALGLVQRQRFVAALKLVPEGSDRLLEIGYGSGVFLPSLSEKAHHLYGIDIHENASGVRNVLKQEGVSAHLLCTPAETLPFGNECFDAVVAVSALEFVDDLYAVCREVKRVLKPGGVFIVITPGNSKLVDLGLLLLTGKSAQKDFGSRRENLVSVIGGFFDLDAKRQIPSFGFSLLRLYTAVRFRKRSQES